MPQKAVVMNVCPTCVGVEASCLVASRRDERLPHVRGGRGNWEQARNLVPPFAPHMRG